MTKDRNAFHLSAQEPLGFLRLHDYIYECLIQEYDLTKRRILIFCVGSAHCTGDLLGPLVGMELEGTPKVEVRGDLTRQMHAGVLQGEIERLQARADRPVVLAVDACLGEKSETGDIEVWKGGLRAGLAVGRALPEFGDITIVGTVGAADQPALRALQNAPLALVVQMAKCIGRALNLLIYRLSG